MLINKFIYFCSTPILFYTNSQRNLLVVLVRFYSATIKHTFPSSNMWNISLESGLNRHFRCNKWQVFCLLDIYADQNERHIWSSFKLLKLEALHWPIIIKLVHICSLTKSRSKPSSTKWRSKLHQKLSTRVSLYYPSWSRSKPFLIFSIISNPFEAKFRHVKISNNTIKTKVMVLKYIQDVL